ncbi:succinyl-diaminopimelate desuccinylase [Candidatus Kinetoplastibacterium desouzaii TCC079E]|uniref:Succinyl-diaminopimelate desuccinylase n=1 Tax=Candidatus Kinetoplastidibacterium desouzai TCC079E TaxID=1208919 RepID=M1L217_9PROT|nr:succinyl-diaminopimelate desuccinylase [Candidatus Kinetoplastibacterium desouzaii]AGF46793.1 succinyl-diaminopimelate desuccinylase [Candidatus Kinetoplastibacterium desouzaii TCC079E]
MKKNDLSTLQITKELVKLKSITPNDAGCQSLIIEILKKLNFKFEVICKNGVTNLWAIRGLSPPLFAFAGHTDVVPTGNISEWATDPFTPTEDNGFLYGRGTADMKGSIAAFLVAIIEFIKDNPDHNGSIALIITSDEEGPANDGTKLICEFLEKKNIFLDYCIVGEPTSEKILGDTYKNGRRGSLSGNLTVKGIQGHVAYPHLANNPIHSIAPALLEITNTNWDNGNEYFPKTTFQISNIHAGNGATNIIPGEINIEFNFRFSTESTPELLQKRINSILDKHHLKYNINWLLNGNPFLTKSGKLTKAISESIYEELGIIGNMSTSGGTSDGRFITKISKEIIEFGPCNATIHKVNEHVKISDLDMLKNIYKKTLAKLLI